MVGSLLSSHEFTLTPFRQTRKLAGEGYLCSRSHCKSLLFASAFCSTEAEGRRLGRDVNVGLWCGLAAGRGAEVTPPRQVFLAGSRQGPRAYLDTGPEGLAPLGQQLLWPLICQKALTVGEICSNLISTHLSSCPSKTHKVILLPQKFCKYLVPAVLCCVH